EPAETVGLVPTFDGPSGAPIFDPCLAYLDCELGESVDAGDHSILIGRVLAAGSDESGMPLVYFNRSYRSVGDLEG
ncbi:MAG: flavin reductase family protein, partial [Dehalococcoidia bacterium]